MLSNDHTHAIDHRVVVIDGGEPGKKFARNMVYTCSVIT